MHLDGRRVRSDLTEAFKIINGYYDVTLDLFFTRSILDIRKCYFSNRIVDKWNV